ncbi:MAG: hypothetical protein Q8K51_14140 [Nitrospirota bacterium]|nr:hypothetical protein [Nitrospirota bacterium]
MARFHKSHHKAIRGFVTHYRHWRSGKLMVASEYGHKAWPFH